MCACMFLSSALRLCLCACPLSVCASVHRYQPRNPVPVTDWTVEAFPSQPADLSDGRSQELLSEGSSQEHVPQRSYQSGPDDRSEICVCVCVRCQGVPMINQRVCENTCFMSTCVVMECGRFAPPLSGSRSQRFCRMWSNMLYTVCFKGPFLQPELVSFKGQCFRIFCLLTWF